MHPAVLEFLAKLVAAAVIAVILGWLDSLFGISTPWWVCAAIGLVVVFGGVLIIERSDDW